VNAHACVASRRCHLTRPTRAPKPGSQADRFATTSRTSAARLLAPGRMVLRSDSVPSRSNVQVPSDETSVRATVRATALPGNGRGQPFWPETPISRAFQHTESRLTTGSRAPAVGFPSRRSRFETRRPLGRKAPKSEPLAFLLSSRAGLVTGDWCGQRSGVSLLVVVPGATAGHVADRAGLEVHLLVRAIPLRTGNQRPAICDGPGCPS